MHNERENSKHFIPFHFIMLPPLLYLGTGDCCELVLEFQLSPESLDEFGFFKNDSRPRRL